MSVAAEGRRLPDMILEIVDRWSPVASASSACVMPESSSARRSTTDTSSSPVDESPYLGFF